MAEENKTTRPLPANYVTILDLQQRWLKQQQKQTEREENQAVFQQPEEKREQSPPPTPIEANADRNPKPRNRNPNQRRNNLRIKTPVEQQPLETNGSASVEVVNEIASPTTIEANADRNRKPRNWNPDRRRNRLRVEAPVEPHPSKTNGSASVEVVNMVVSPDPEIGEQESKKSMKQWKKKEKRKKMKKKETVKSMPEDEEAAIVCALAEMSVNDNASEKCYNEIRCNSRLVNVAKARKKEVDRREEIVVKDEKRGWRGGSKVVARQADWRYNGGYVRYDRRMRGGGKGNELVWVKKANPAS